MSKRYDQAYFDRWYRDPRHRVNTPAGVRRKVRLVLGVAEVLLERPVRSILDVGCGEAPWRSHFLDERPKAEYVGVDSSEYVVTRFGRTRGIRAGTFGTLGAIGLTQSFDLVVCCDVLQYVPADELAPGLQAIAARLDGVAYLEAFTNVDELEGDKRHWHHRTPAWYRHAFRDAGLTAVGMHCYVGEPLRDSTLALERAE
ncbi:MAG: class I SAM-dependent methyltransferase [Gemmatimonadota bacterium]|nr:class I SAM-dependent methyltransferase [Gemmatimonadota bacterium]